MDLNNISNVELDFLKINDELEELENNFIYSNLESRILNIFSTGFNDRELKKLVSYNDRINDYINFISNSEMFISDKIKERVAKLKTNVYKKTSELKDYKENLPSFNESVLDLKKYILALDLIFSTNEKSFDDYKRNTAILYEIKLAVNQTSDYCNDFNYIPAKQIVQYSYLITSIIDNKFNEMIKAISKQKLNFQNYLGNNNNNNNYNNNNNNKKIFYEERVMQAEDCLDLLYKSLKKQ
jgi:hypothetical protein